MPIPDYQTLMLPLLRLVSDGKEHRINDLAEQLSEIFSLSEEERKTLLPSGQTFLFGNRVAWAKTYLKKAGLLISARRATVAITRRGLDVLANSPTVINVRFLRQFPEFVEFQAPKKADETSKPRVQQESQDEQTPEETLESAYLRIRKSVADDLLNE